MVAIRRLSYGSQIIIVIFIVMNFHLQSIQVLVSGNYKSLLHAVLYNNLKEIKVRLVGQTLHDHSRLINKCRPINLKM